MSTQSISHTAQRIAVISITICLTRVHSSINLRAPSAITFQEQALSPEVVFAEGQLKPTKIAGGRDEQLALAVEEERAHRVSIDHLKTNVIKALEETSISTLLRLKIETRFPHGIILKIYPADVPLTRKLSDIEIGQMMTVIQLPPGALGIVRISIIEANGHPAIYIQELYPSFAIRNITNEPLADQLGKEWAYQVIDYLKNVTERAEFESLYAVTPKLAKLQNPRINQGAVRTYYSHPFRQTFNKQLTQFRNIYYSWDDVRQYHVLEKSEYGEIRYLTGGQLELWRWDVPRTSLPTAA